MKILKILSNINSLTYSSNNEGLIYIFKKNNRVIQKKLLINISQINFNYILYKISNQIKKNLSIQVALANAFYKKD